MANGEQLNLELLIKMLKMTRSDNDNQALVAMRKANEALDRASEDWDTLIRGKVKIIEDPFKGFEGKVNVRPTPAAAKSPPPNPQSTRRSYTPPPYTPPPPPYPPMPIRGDTRYNSSFRQDEIYDGYKWIFMAQPKGTRRVKNGWNQEFDGFDWINISPHSPMKATAGPQPGSRAGRASKVRNVTIDDLI